MEIYAFSFLLMYKYYWQMVDTTINCCMCRENWENKEFLLYHRQPWAMIFMQNLYFKSAINSIYIYNSAICWNCTELTHEEVIYVFVWKKNVLPLY